MLYGGIALTYLRVQAFYYSIVLSGLRVSIDALQHCSDNRASENRCPAAFVWVTSVLPQRCADMFASDSVVLQALSRQVASVQRCIAALFLQACQYVHSTDPIRVTSRQLSLSTDNDVTSSNMLIPCRAVNMATCSLAVSLPTHGVVVAERCE